jgi:hypothetical protein
MKLINPAFQNTIIKTEVRTDSVERLFVWSVWLIMFSFALFCIFKYGRNIPLAEDWLLVAPLTGNETDFFGWLWAQNNEHRIPVPKLIFLVLLKLTNGDFRAGMYFNAIVLGGISLAMIQVARYIRGERNKIVDAFYPIILLHIGQWENLVWSWQISIVFPVALVLSIFLVCIVSPILTNKTAVVFTAISLILLPLCGGIGILYAPFFSLWLICCAIFHWKGILMENRSKQMSVFLIGSATITLIIVGVYFIGYERPTWNPPSPGFKATLITSAKFLALGLGPVAAKFWKLSILFSFIVLLPSTWLALRGVLLNKKLEQYRALILFLFFGNLALFALAMGWGRAGLVPTVGLPIRYVLLAVPAFCAAFFVWELYGSKHIRNIMQMSLLIIMVVLIPYNTTMGFGWRNWYLTGMNAIEKDLSQHTPHSVLAKHHGKFLIHWWDEKQLTRHIQMLYDNKIGPFADIRKDSTNTQVSNLK